MPQKPPITRNKFTEKVVPSSRLSRVAKLGSLAGSITGNVIKNSVSSALRAQLPTTQNTLLSLDNAKSITKHLLHMRGAAMKIGQMLSMDAGEILPKEWETILAALREQAHIMPRAQLEAILVKNWGANWQTKFESFDLEPIAAASIGQVHKAQLKNGDWLAIKVQYPGVAESIDSDIDNVLSLLKLTRLIPKGVDISRLLSQAKEQLTLEADYEHELNLLKTYKKYLNDDQRYIVPACYESLSSKNILCMEFIDALPMSHLAYETSSTKNLVVERVFDLLFKELFVFKFIQSDPNYSNFLYKESTKQVVLLDCGACRTISHEASKAYLSMANAMYRLDRMHIEQALFELGLVNENVSSEVINTVLDACMLAGESLQSDRYNFKRSHIITRLRNATQSLINGREVVGAPEFDVALINRKVTGSVMLANKFGADIPLLGLLLPYFNERTP